MTVLADQTGAIVLIGDKIAPTEYLRNLVGLIGKENEQINEENRIHYVVCKNYADLAVALKQNRDRIRLVLIGPGLDGKPDMISRMLGRNFETVLVVDSDISPLAEDPDRAKTIEDNLRGIGIRVIAPTDGTEDFYTPIVQDTVVRGLSSQAEIKDMSPEDRAQLLDARLESVTRFPTLPETQQRVAALTDDSPPKKWAEAIDPDIPVRKVILQSLNSAAYGFRHPIRTIEQAVSLATTRTVRELVMACTVQRLFSQVEEARVDQFWQHSVATGLFARLLTLPADAQEQDPQQKNEFARFNLNEEQTAFLDQAAVWKKFDIPRDEDPFTAGLLHDIGKVTMVLCFEECLDLIDPIVDEACSKAEEKNQIWAEPSSKIERALLQDIDHEVIGHRIAKRWHLAPWLTGVIGQHHSVQRKSPELHQVIALADLAANSLASYPVREGQHPMQKLVAKVGEAAKSEEDFGKVIEGTSKDIEKVLSKLEVPSHLWKFIEYPQFFELCYRVGPRVRELTRTFLSSTKS